MGRKQGQFKGLKTVQKGGLNVLKNRVKNGLKTQVKIVCHLQ